LGDLQQRKQQEQPRLRRQDTPRYVAVVDSDSESDSDDASAQSLCKEFTKGGADHAPKAQFVLSPPPPPPRSTRAGPLRASTPQKGVKDPIQALKMRDFAARVIRDSPRPQKIATEKLERFAKNYKPKVHALWQLVIHEIQQGQQGATIRQSGEKRNKDALLF